MEKKKKGYKDNISDFFFFFFFQAAQWLDTEPTGWEDLVQMNCDPTDLLPLLQSDHHKNLERNGKAFMKAGGRLQFRGKSLKMGILILGVLIYLSSDRMLKRANDESLMLSVVCLL